MEYFLDPLDYINVYHYSLMIVLLLCYTKSLSDKSSQGLNFIVMALFYILIVFIGFRPVSWSAFGDMGSYARNYVSFKSYYDIEVFESDFLFYFIMSLFSKLSIPIGFYFTTMYVLYSAPLLIFSKKHFRKMWPYAFLMFLSFFEYFSYATNGIRNGIACSMFILALSFPKNKLLRNLFLIISVSFHFSLIIPVSGYFIYIYFQKIKYFIVFWFSALIISFFSGNFFISFFNQFFTERTNHYFTSQEDVIYKTGFRIDFILYSFIGVLASYFYLYKKEFKCEFYNKLVAVFLFSNALWLLVIRANFSNRIAYLSWFILAPVIIYPLLKTKLLKYQFSRICLIILFFFSISLYLNILR